MFPADYFAASYFGEDFYSAHGVVETFAYGGLLLMLGVE